MAQGSSSIITMLPNTSHVEAVYLGNPELAREGIKIDSSPSAAVAGAGRDDNEMGRGILDWVQPGTLLVDSSTIDPLASRRVNAVAKSKVSQTVKDESEDENQLLRGGGKRRKWLLNCSSSGRWCPWVRFRNEVSRNAKGECPPLEEIMSTLISLCMSEQKHSKTRLLEAIYFTWYWRSPSTLGDLRAYTLIS